MARGPVYIPDKFIDTWAWSSKNFWNKIIKGHKINCWTWTGSTGPNGPLFGAKRQDETGEYKPRMTQARRILYYETTGEYLANRTSIYHSCGNSHCMNPDHLTLDRPSPRTYTKSQIFNTNGTGDIEYDPHGGAN